MKIQLFGNRMSTNDYKRAISVQGMLTVSEVAQLLSVHPNTVRHWTDIGLLKAYRFGYRRDRRFKPGEVDKFLRENQR